MKRQCLSIQTTTDERKLILRASEKSERTISGFIKVSLNAPLALFPPRRYQADEKRGETVSVSLPFDIYEQVRKEAQENGMSINAVIRRKLITSAEDVTK